MKGYVNWMEKNPRIVKLIFCIPGLHLLWGFYRLFKSVVEKNTGGIILAIILLLIGWIILWLVDIVTIIISNEVLWI